MTAGALANLIKKRCGIIVPDRKLDSLLAVVKAKHPGQTMDEAVRSLETGPGLPDWLISATTINETFFFRHPEQFKFVEEWVGANRGTGRMRVLCLGCSTGEEPYSLAMLMHKAVGAGNFEITAVDLDPQVLETAKAGRYPESSVFRTPAAYRDVLSKHVKRLQWRGRAAHRGRQGHSRLGSFRTRQPNVGAVGSLRLRHGPQCSDLLEP